MRVTVRGGIAENRSTHSARSAAPVGVVSSPEAGPVTTGTAALCSSSAVAGAGTGRVPCDVSTVPDPTATGVATSEVIPNACRPAQAPTMSTMESMAPTSWKWTSSTVVPWTVASA